MKKKFNIGGFFEPPMFALRFLKEFTANDLMALTILSKNKVYYGSNIVIYSKTYGELVDVISGNRNRKNAIAVDMTYNDSADLSYKIKDRYLKSFKDNNLQIRKDLFVFKMWIAKEHPTKELIETLNEIEKVRIYNIELEQEINCQGSGICEDFVFYNKFIDDLVDKKVESIEIFKERNPEDKWNE